MASHATHPANDSPRTGRPAVRRHLPVLAASLWIIALPMFSGCKKSTAPDRNAGLYGTWNGTLTETTQTSGGPTVNQYGITIVFAKGSVGFYLGGAQYPATIVIMLDPNVSFEVTNGSTAITYVATRTGGTMNGTGTWPSGTITDVWAVTKASPSTLPLAVKGERDPRFGEQ